MKETEVTRLLNDWQDKLEEGEGFIKDWGWELVIGDGDKDIIVHRSNGEETSSWVFEMCDEYEFKAEELSDDEERRLEDFLSSYLCGRLTLKGA